MPPPPHRPQPGPRPANRRLHPRHRRPRPKPLEPRRRRARIQRPPIPWPVLPKIHQYVDQPVPNLPRRPQSPRMVPIPPDRPRSPQRAVDRPRQPNRQPAGPPREPPRIGALHDEMHVICLHREVHHTKARGSPETVGFPRFARARLAPMASRIAPNTASARSDGSPACARRVTCTGKARLCSGRARCTTGRLRPGIGRRPAPALLPPQPAVLASGSCLGLLAFILIGATSTTKCSAGSTSSRQTSGRGLNRSVGGMRTAAPDPARPGGVGGGGGARMAVDMPGYGRQTAHSPWTNAQKRRG